MNGNIELKNQHIRFSMCYTYPAIRFTLSLLKKKKKVSQHQVVITRVTRPPTNPYSFFDQALIYIVECKSSSPLEECERRNDLSVG